MRRTKLSVLQEHLSAGRDIEALRIAKGFPQLGDDAVVITRGWAAHTNPWMYIEMGRDPELLTADAIAAIRRRYRHDPADRRPSP